MVEDPHLDIRGVTTVDSEGPSPPTRTFQYVGAAFTLTMVDCIGQLGVHVIFYSPLHIFTCTFGTHLVKCAHCPCPQGQPLLIYEREVRTHRMNRVSAAVNNEALDAFARTATQPLLA